MSYQVDIGTHATFTGQVDGVPSIAGWVLTLEGQGEDEDFRKSSTDVEEIEILDVDARTFAIYFTPVDTVAARDIYAHLRAVDADGEKHVLRRVLIEIVP